MKTDAYTKSVLTVIALCLVVLVLRGVELLPRAVAGAAAAPALPAGYALVPVDADGAVKVRLSPAEEVNVNIKSVDHNPIIGGKLPVAVYW